MTIADSEPVKKVRKALKDAGLADNVVEFDADGKRRRHRQGPGYGTGRRCHVARLRPRRMVLVLVTGDHECLEASLAAAFFLEGAVRVPSDPEVRGITGFTADCVPPVGFAHKLPTAIDRSLKRFEHLYAVAGDPQCVFKTPVTDLMRLT